MAPDFESLRKEILDRFYMNIQAHWDKDVDFIIDDLSDDFFSISGGEITRPFKEEQRASFTQYLNSATFSEYASLTEPEIGFSDDGTMAWGNYKIKIKGEIGSRVFDAEYAWLWLFRRVDGRWMRIGEVSTQK